MPEREMPGVDVGAVVDVVLAAERRGDRDPVRLAEGEHVRGRLRRPAALADDRERPLRARASSSPSRARSSSSPGAGRATCAGAPSSASVSSKSTSSGQREHDRSGPTAERDRERRARRAPAVVRPRRPPRPTWRGRARRTRAGSRAPGTRPGRGTRRGTWPTSRIIGVESCEAMWTPTLACVAPGPRVTRQTPGRPVSFPYASAMFAAAASWRHEISRMFASWSASSTGR